MACRIYYGPADRGESIAHHSRRAGCGDQLLDTGIFYGIGHNELLIREALEGRSRDNVQISVSSARCATPPAAFTGVWIAAPWW